MTLDLRDKGGRWRCTLRGCRQSGMEHIAQCWTVTFVSGCGANEVEIMTYLIKLLPTLLLIFHPTKCY